MVKQFVNLPFDKSRKHKDYGRSVPLVATPQQLGKQVGATEWWVEPIGGKNTDPKYLSAAQRAAVQRQLVTPRNGKFYNTLDLPHVGGDKYVVKCAKKGERGKAIKIEEFETWRRIFYTVHWMNAKCKRMFDAVKGKTEAAFQDGFVEFKNVADAKMKKDEPRTARTDAALNLPQLYDTNKKLTDRPFHVRIAVLNDIYVLTERPDEVPAWGSATFDMDGGEPLADRTPADWLKSAHAYAEPSGRWYDVKRHVKKKGDDSYAVDVSGHKALQKALRRGKTLFFRIVTRRRDHLEGYSVGNFCAVRIESPGAKDVQANMLQTFTHEVGHGLQQVVEKETLYDAAGKKSGEEKNPKWHTNNFGGVGNHCSTNAVLGPDPARGAGAQIFRAGWWTRIPVIGGKLCTMYFAAEKAVDPDGKFCPSCVPRLIRTNLEKKKMAAKFWDYFP